MTTLPSPGLRAGVARMPITPFPGVELAGWGYYLHRTWETILDDLCVTAVCFEDSANAMAVVTFDLMTIGGAFVQQLREAAARRTGIPSENMLLTASHSHNAPTTGALLGVGDEHPDYVAMVHDAALTAIEQAWETRQSAAVASGSANCDGLTFNRTRDRGPVDETLTVLRVDPAEPNGNRPSAPLAVLVNYQAHPTVFTNLFPTAVSRDVPGQVVERIESAYPGTIAAYLQGACGDVNFLREFQTIERRHEPGDAVANASLKVLRGLSGAADPHAMIRTDQRTVELPVRRWSDEELQADREEAAERLANRRLDGWRDSIGKVMVNRPDDMVRRHGGDEWRAVEAMCRFQVEWTDRMRREMSEHQRLVQPAEVQTLRIGDLGIVANATEFFTTLALDVRQRSALPQLMIAAYSNGRIGYLPDAHDVQRKTYAAHQSPKYCTQHPFVAESGPAMCDAMVESIRSLA